MAGSVTLKQADLELPHNSEKYDMARQLTIIGRGECGKTSILQRFFHNEFNVEINATAIENTDYVFQAEKRRFKLKIWDTSGQDDFSRLRIVTLPMSDYIIICYSITDPLSFYEVEDTLVPMVKQKGRENVKIMLVATKTDKRTEEMISKEEGGMLAKRIGAFTFFECSSLSGAGIQEIFAQLRRDMVDTLLPRKNKVFSWLHCC